MIYRVIVDVSNTEVDRVFDYSAERDVPVGSRVLVPFGKRTLEGFVIGTKEKTDIQYDSDNDNIFSKDYDNRHNLDIQEQKLKYFSNYRNPCTYIENKVKKENKMKKIKM